MVKKKTNRRAGDAAARQRVEQNDSAEYAPQGLEFHPLANIFPLLEGAEFDGLVADVRGPHGVHEKIWLYEGKILDGRNRYRAAAVAGVACPMRPYTGNDPIGFVISLNLKRRHLSESQRAMVAAKLATLRAGDNQYSEGLPIGRSSELLNVGERSVARARDVRESGAPELVRAVEAGTVSVAAAADIATLPPEEQRAILANADERQVLRRASEIRMRRTEQRRAERFARIASTANTGPLPRDRTFPLLLVDPAFSLGEGDRSPSNHYPCMSLDEICALPVGEIATPSAALFLWVPASLLFEAAPHLFTAWGFTYRDNIAWEKTNGPGLGFYVRHEHELLLLATRGDMPPPPPHLRPSSVLRAPRREHSRKPDEAYELIERMYPDLPKIELFARRRRPGWQAWGNELPPAEDAEEPDHERMLGRSPVASEATHRGGDAMSQRMPTKEEAGTP